MESVTLMAESDAFHLAAGGKGTPLAPPPDELIARRRTWRQPERSGEIRFPRYVVAVK